MSDGTADSTSEGLNKLAMIVSCGHWVCLTNLLYRATPESFLGSVGVSRAVLTLGAAAAIVKD